jgi:hypothetical protein
VRAPKLSSALRLGSVEDCGQAIARMADRISMTRFALCATAVTLASALVFAQAPNGGGPGPVLGIVEIPKIFAIDPETGRVVPRGALTLYTRPDSNSKTATAISEPQAIDDAEYGYEEPGALVYRREAGYYLIRTARGTAWLSPADAGPFHSFETLVSQGLAYLTDAWDGFISASPGNTTRTRVQRSQEGADHVEVKGFRRVGGSLWLQVEVMSHSLCTSTAPATTKARGWVAAHAGSGAPAVWFHSRGC